MAFGALRVTLAFCLVVSSFWAGLAPTASACNAVIGDHQTFGIFGNCLHPDVDVLGETIPYLTPCLKLDVGVDRPPTAGGGTLGVRVDPPEALCGESAIHVNFQWHATPFGGKGNATFALDTTGMPILTMSSDPGDVHPYAVSSFGEILGALLEHEEPRVVQASVPLPLSPTAASGGLPVPRTVVSVAFDASWGDDCASAQGSVRASVNDRPLEDVAAPSDLQQLCLLSRSADADHLASAATSVAAQIAQRFAATVPALRAVAEGLAAGVVDEARVPGTPAVAVPTPPDPPALPDAAYAAAAGASTITLFNATSLLSEEHDVEVRTPIGDIEAAGGESVSSPALVPASFAKPPVDPESARAVAVALDDRAPSDARAHAIDPLQPPASDEPPAPPHPEVTVLVVGHPASTRDPSWLLAWGGLAVAAEGALLLLAFTLYQRVTRPAALRHEGRAALMRACEVLQRAATASELACATGMLRKTAEYHLRYLARLGYLRAEESADGPRRFALHSVPPGPATGTARVASLDEAVLERICAQPGITAVQLERDLGVARRRVDRRVKDLVLAGLVTRRSEEGVRLYPT